MKRKIPIIILGFVISCSIVIFCVNFLLSLYATYDYANGLSKDYVSIRIESNDGIKFEDIISCFSGEEDLVGTIVFQYDDMISGMYSYSNAEIMNRLCEGRFFSKEDFENDHYVAIVSNALRKKCFQEENSAYILLSDCKYEVIGFFEPLENAVYSNSSIFCSVDKKVVLERNALLSIDYGENTEKAVKLLQSRFSVKTETTINKGNVIDHVKLALDNNTQTGMLICMGMIVVMFDMAFSVKLWMLTYEKEAMIRIVCGAHRRKIRIWFIGKYNTNYLAGALPGIIIAGTLYGLLGKMGVFTSGFFISVLAAFIISVVVGDVYIILLLFLNRKSKIKGKS